MAEGSGVNLGRAQGKITIDFSDLNNVKVAAHSVGAAVEKDLGKISAAAKKTESSGKDLAALFGVVWGPQLLRAAAQFVIQADEVATAYKRQSIAAVNLAGSQDKLNALLASYDKVTGGAIAKATALSDVVGLQAIGFADSTAELERFVSAARGISLAKGQSQDYTISQLQLAIANQSTMRLDQLGIGVDELNVKLKQLKTANGSLTGAQLYQNAILEIAEKKYGALTKSTEAQATGLEKARKAWADMTLEIGKAAGPATGGVMDGLTAQILGVSKIMQDAVRDAHAMRDAIKGMSGGGEFLGALGDALSASPLNMISKWLNSQLGLTEPGGPSNTSAGSGSRARGRGFGDALTAPGFSPDVLAAQRSAKIDFENAIQGIERSANEARLSSTAQYEQQRSEVIRSYGLGVAREAEDFARSRARAQVQFDKQVADIHEQASQREADAQTQFDKQVADINDEGNKRIADMQADYFRNRERAERDHRDTLFSAASRLDAVAVAAEQKRFARQTSDAEQDFQERISDERANLQERIAQEQAAHGEQLASARAADEERIADMVEAQNEAQRLEDEDRALAASRAAEDHAAQLAAMDAAHAEDMAQIARQEAEERKAAEDAHMAEMEKLGVILSAGWKSVQDAIEAEMLKSYDEFVKTLAGRDKRLKQAIAMAEADSSGGLDLAQYKGYAQGGFVGRTGLAYMHQGELVLNRQQQARGGGTMNVAININGTGLNPEAIAEVVNRRLEAHYREMLN